METVLEVQNLHKKFKKFTAVKDVSLSVGRGEVLGLLGPNGAGKTTTIQMLLGVMKPTSGSIKYFGKDFWQHRSEVMEQIGFSSTYVHLPWDLKVKEVLNYLSYMYALPDRKGRIAELADIFRLGKLMELQIRDLSAGQSTRLNMAKAFINKPKVLLLDEPTASLDPEIADFIRKFLAEQSSRNDLSIVITSHNMAEVEELCDRVIFINEGKVVANDTPTNLAKTMETAHLELMFVEGLDQAEKLAKKNNYKLSSAGHNRLKVELKETEIPEFLQELLQNKLRYQEISIDKPSLEDYFIQLSKKNNNVD